MVYHFEAQIPACLHTTVCKGKEEGERGRAHKEKEQRDRKEKRRRDGVQREDLSHKVEQQKQGKEMDKEKERGGKSMSSLFHHTVLAV